VPYITLVKGYIPIFLFPLHSFVYCWSFHLILRVFFSTMHLADRRRQSGSLFLQLCMQKISIWLTVAASVVWPCVWTICSLSVCHTLHMLLMPYHSMYIYIYIYIWHTFSRCPRNGESRVD